MERGVKQSKVMWYRAKRVEVGLVRRGAEGRGGVMWRLG